MKTLLVVIVLLVAVIAAAGFNRGWFHLSANSTDQHPSATFTVDKDKIHADEQKAMEKVHGLGQTVKDKTGELTDKVKR